MRVKVVKYDVKIFNGYCKLMIKYFINNLIKM